MVDAGMQFAGSAQEFSAGEIEATVGRRSMSGDMRRSVARWHRPSSHGQTGRKVGCLSEWSRAAAAA